MKNISLFLNIYLCQLPTHNCFTVHTDTLLKCNLFVLYDKNSNGLLKDLGGMKKEKQVRWCDLTWITVNNQWKCTQKSRYCIKIRTLHQLTLKNTELYQRVQLFSSLHSYLRQLKSFWFLSAVAWICYCANKHLISLGVNACIAIKHRKRKPLHASYMMYFSQIFVD